MESMNERIAVKTNERIAVKTNKMMNRSTRDQPVRAQLHQGAPVPVPRQHTGGCQGSASGRDGLKSRNDMAYLLY